MNESRLLMETMHIRGVDQHFLTTEKKKTVNQKI